MEPFIGQIIMFGGNFAPTGWAFCNGDSIAVSDNQALFSLLGTTYGGDGRTNFKLPDLRGRVPMHAGSGPGLTTRGLGEKGGSEATTLPAHTHDAEFHLGLGASDTASGSGHAIAVNSGGDTIFTDEDPTIDKKLTTGTVVVKSAGQDASSANVQPFQCINFIIALVGTYPPRN